MITANKLVLLCNMPPSMLEMALPKKDRPSLTSAQFLGLTNGYEFCYSVSMVGGEVGKVFLRYDPALDQVIGTLG
jgi:hypothetical protein